MSNFLKNFEGEPDPFFEHPLASIFMQSAIEALETTGSPKIPNEKIIELMGIFGLDRGEAAARAYMAQNRTEEMKDFDLGLQEDLVAFSLGAEI